MTRHGGGDVPTYGGGAVPTCGVPTSRRVDRPFDVERWSASGLRKNAKCWRVLDYGMWRSRNNRDGTVVCIACGTSVPRSEAREYDKEGNRWERRGKTFEHLCKECYRDLCHQSRDELESLLVRLERSESAAESRRGERHHDESREDDVERSQVAFVSRYFRAVEERYGRADGAGRDG
jgi:uncharacterized Zn finger protein (UPF0148 family)